MKNDYRIKSILGRSCICLIIAASLCGCTRIDADVGLSGQNDPIGGAGSLLTHQLVAPSSDLFGIEYPYSELFDCAVRNNQSSWTLSIPSISVLAVQESKDHSVYFCKIHYYEYEIEDATVVDRGEYICRAFITLEDTLTTFDIISEQDTIEKLRNYGFAEIAEHIENGQPIDPIWSMETGHNLLSQYCAETGITLLENEL